METKEIRFKLNYNNNKDKIILDYLDKQYNSIEYIKMLLHYIAINEFDNSNILFNRNINIATQGQLMVREGAKGSLKVDEGTQEQLIMQSIVNKSADSNVECPEITSSDTKVSFDAQIDNDALKNEFSEFF